MGKTSIEIRNYYSDFGAPEPSYDLLETGVVLAITNRARNFNHIILENEKGTGCPTKKFPNLFL